jgi:HEAT repeat protein
MNQRTRRLRTAAVAAAALLALAACTICVLYRFRGPGTAVSTRPAPPAPLARVLARPTRVSGADIRLAAGARDPRVPAALAATLRHRDLEVRRSSVSYIAHLSCWSITHSALAAAVERALAREDDLRALEHLCIAAVLVARTGERRSPIAQVIGNRLGRERDEEAVELLVRAAGDIGEAEPTLLDSLSEVARAAPPDLALRAHAAIVKLTGEPDEHLDRIVDAALPGGDAAQRSLAWSLLGWLGPTAAESMDRLGPTIGEEPYWSGLEWRSIQAMGYAGPVGTARIMDLATGTGGPSSTRALTLEVLGSLRGERQVLEPFLVQQMALPDQDVSASAARALGAIGAETEEAVQALLAAACAPSEPVRCIALGALGEIQRDDNEVLDCILAAAGDPNEGVRMAAMEALGACGVRPDLVLPVLIEHIVDEDLYVRIEALYALGRWGPEAAEAVPAIARALSPNDPYAIGPAAYEALSCIGPSAWEAGPALEDLLAWMDRRLPECGAYDHEYWWIRQVMADIGWSAGESTSPHGSPRSSAASFAEPPRMP